MFWKSGAFFGYQAFKELEREEQIYEKPKVMRMLKASTETLGDRVRSSESKELSCIIKIKTLSRGYFGGYGEMKTQETGEIPLRV